MRIRFELNYFFQDFAYAFGDFTGADILGSWGRAMGKSGS